MRLWKSAAVLVMVFLRESHGKIERLNWFSGVNERSIRSLQCAGWGLPYRSPQRHSFTAWPLLSRELENTFRVSKLVNNVHARWADRVKQTGQCTPAEIRPVFPDKARLAISSGDKSQSAGTRSTATQKSSKESLLLTFINNLLSAHDNRSGDAPSKRHLCHLCHLRHLLTKLFVILHRK